MTVQAPVGSQQAPEAQLPVGHAPPTVRPLTSVIEPPARVLVPGVPPPTGVMMMPETVRPPPAEAPPPKPISRPTMEDVH